MFRDARVGGGGCTSLRCFTKGNSFPPPFTCTPSPKILLLPLEHIFNQNFTTGCLTSALCSCTNQMLPGLSDQHFRQTRPRPFPVTLRFGTQYCPVLALSPISSDFPSLLLSVGLASPSTAGPVGLEGPRQAAGVLLARPTIPLAAKVRELSPRVASPRPPVLLVQTSLQRPHCYALRHSIHRAAKTEPSWKPHL